MGRTVQNVCSAILQAAVVRLDQEIECRAAECTLGITRGDYFVNARTVVCQDELN